ncbi:hypothetical protein [Vulcanisaeta distributa]|uniref:hypothetical protein n=1 Tax=Vulcanisaeta distributa TaxID=164451 RepID=UPI0006D03ED1|nr:hypothetical protein [Vulcanisaeta distributa]
MSRQYLHYNYVFVIYVNGTAILMSYLISGTFIVAHHVNGVFGFIDNIYYDNCLGITPLGFNNDSVVLTSPLIGSLLRVSKYVGLNNSIVQLMNEVVSEYR